MFIKLGFNEDEEEEFEEADAFPVLQTTKGTQMNQRFNKIRVLVINLEINQTTSMASKNKYFVLETKPNQLFSASNYHEFRT